MAFTAVMGLFFNLIQMRILGGDGEHGHGHSHDLGGAHANAAATHHGGVAAISGLILAILTNYP